MVLALVRGDHRLNETKLRNALGADFRQATAEEIEAELGPPGFIGPVGADVPVLKDAAIEGSGYFAGANRPDAHLIGVEPGRDFAFEELDFRSVEAGDLAPSGDPIEIETAIEVGNIFKLGTRYSEPFGATYLDAEGKEHPIVMGCYGIGPARIVAAAIEQNADEKGIVWPRAQAPWQVHLVALGKPGEETFEAAERLYEELEAAGLETLFDDREAGPGEKLTDAELLGCPLRIVVGKRALAEGEVEAQERRVGSRAPARGRATRRAGRREILDAPQLSAAMPSKRRLFGIDRSGPLARGHAQGGAAASVDDPQPRRLPAARGDPGVPRPRLRLRRRPGDRARR